MCIRLGDFYTNLGQIMHILWFRKKFVIFSRGKHVFLRIFLGAVCGIDAVYAKIVY